jgi:uncharacterized protein (TIGR02145 family)
MQRKISLSVLIVISAFVGLVITDSNAENICGDVNCDMTCNVSDAVYIVNYIFIGGAQPCDPDNDGIPDCGPDCCPCPPIVTDIDGNTYFTVKIGDQCWMAQDLRVTHYRNGDPIPNITDNAEWEGLSEGAYCYFNNDPSIATTYGLLYNWFAVNDSRNIAPEGWHVPTADEWQVLIDYLGGWEIAGGKVKETGTLHWEFPNTGASNDYGFTALGHGYRYYGGTFYDLRINASFWSSTDIGNGTVSMRDLDYDNADIFEHFADKRYGFGIRCIKD